MRAIGHRPREAWLAVVGFVLVACSAARSAPSPLPPPSVDEACGELADALVAYGHCNAGAFGRPPARDRIVASCQRRLGASGVVAAAATMATQCASSLRSAAAACDPVDDATCAAPPGMLVTGAACGTALQCASGYCVGPQSTTAEGATPFRFVDFAEPPALVTCGTCGERIAKGGSCSPSVPQCGPACNVVAPPCALGTFCKVDVGQSGTCVETAPAVAGGGVDAPCTVGCKRGLRCDAATQRCAPPSANGGPCNDVSTDCVTGLACSLGQCVPVRGAGQGCGDVPPRSVSVCAPGLVCDPASNSCEAVSFGPPGAPCDEALARCATGRCIPPPGSARGVCAAVIADGQPCRQGAPDETCEDGAVCLTAAALQGCCFASGPGTADGGSGGPDGGALATCVRLDPRSCH